MASRQGKLAGWEYWSAEVKAEVRFGGPRVTSTGTISITTKAYTPFDAIGQAIIRGPPIRPVEPQRGSWSVNYVFRQYLVERAPRDGWGVFGQVSLADKATSPITTFFDLGLGGATASSRVGPATSSALRTRTTRT